jgi:hypothetical protein
MFTSPRAFDRGAACRNRAAYGFVLEIGSDSCHDEVRKTYSRQGPGIGSDCIDPERPTRPRLSPDERTQSLVLWLFPS